LEKERAQVSALEKKQRKFDQVCAIGCLKNLSLAEMLTMRVFVSQLLAEEKAISEKNAVERDNAERDARQNETKVCVTNNFY